MVTAKNLTLIILSISMFSSTTCPIGYVDRWIVRPCTSIASQVYVLCKRRPKTLIAMTASLTGIFLSRQYLKTKNERLLHAYLNNHEIRMSFLALLGATIPIEKQGPLVQSFIENMHNNKYKDAQELIDLGLQLPADQATQYTHEFLEAFKKNNREAIILWAQAGISLAKQNPLDSDILFEELLQAQKISTSDQKNPHLSSNIDDQQSNHLDNALFLICLGGKINTHEQHVTLLFHTATIEGKTRIVYYMIKAGTNVNAVDSNGNTAVHLAACNGFTGIIRVLLDNKADINLQNKRLQTPLLVAIRANIPETVWMLLRNGADVNLAAADKITPLMYAAMKGMTKYVRRLLACPNIDVHCQDAQGRTALELASNNEIKNMLIEYIKTSASDSNQSHEGSTSLFGALLKKNMGFVKDFCQLGIQRDIRDHLGCTALIRAIQLKNEPAALLFIENGADVNIHDSIGMTPLMYAAQMGLEQIALRLIEHHADINAQNNGGWTSLMWATVADNHSIIQALLKSGAKKDTKTDDGLTAVQIGNRDKLGESTVTLVHQASA